MITADKARELSNDLNTPRAKEALAAIEKDIIAAAAFGLFEVEVSTQHDIPSLFTYLESQGYMVRATRSEYNELLRATIYWK